MRIIAGQARGRRFKARKDPAVRPISGRIKQSLFDILAHVMPGAKVLDLFAGTGAVGIEALSRGAEFAFFIDADRRGLADLERNLAALGYANRAKVHPGNVLEDLSWVPFRSGVAAFDIVFLGPPYKDLEKKPLAYSTPALARVAEAGLAAPGAIVVLQHQVREKVEAPAALEHFRQAKYGDTFLEFYRARA